MTVGCKKATGETVRPSLHAVAPVDLRSGAKSLLLSQ